MGGEALQQGEGIAHAVGGGVAEHGRVELRIDGHYLLKEGREGAVGMPEHRGEVRAGFTLLGELGERMFPLLRDREVQDELLNSGHDPWTKWSEKKRTKRGEFFSHACFIKVLRVRAVVDWPTRRRLQNITSRT